MKAEIARLTEKVFVGKKLIYETFSDDAEISTLISELQSAVELGATKIMVELDFENDVEIYPYYENPESDEDYETRVLKIKKQAEQIARDQETQQRYMYEQLKKIFEP